MEKDQALQDINYIKELIRETQRVVDYGWPVFMYWGFYILTNLTVSSTLIDWETVNRPGLTWHHVLVYILRSGLWIGFLFTALYVFYRRKLMSNPKMFLVGAVALAFVTVYMAIRIGEDLIWAQGEWQGNILFWKYYILTNGIYFGTLFMVLGLIYSREQLWMGYGVLLVALLTLFSATYLAEFGFFIGDIPFWAMVGLSFLLSGLLAYRRQKKSFSRTQPF